MILRNETSRKLSCRVFPASVAYSLISIQKYSYPHPCAASVPHIYWHLVQKSFLNLIPISALGYVHTELSPERISCSCDWWSVAVSQGRSVSVHSSHLCSLALSAKDFLFAESHSRIKAEKCKPSIYVKRVSSATTQWWQWSHRYLKALEQCKSHKSGNVH